jgi:penicillin-binding protein 1A
MQTVHTTLKDKKFEKPPAIIQRKVCRKSGLLATEGCEHDLRGNCTYSEYFIDGTQPRTRCNLHTSLGTINMPKKYIDQISDDTNYITPNFDVVPILPDETTMAPSSNIIIAPSSANAPY